MALVRWKATVRLEDDLAEAEAAHHRMVQPDRYKRWHR
jgi:hypothetical protein